MIYIIGIYFGDIGLANIYDLISTIFRFELMLSFRVSFLITLLSFCLIFSNAQASVLQLEEETKSISLFDAFEVLEDVSGELIIEEVSNSKKRTSFKPHKGFSSLGHSASAFWFRFKVQRMRNANQDWYLTLGRPILNNIDVYLENSDQYTKTRLGDHVLLVDRAIKSRSYAARLQLNDYKPHYVYIRVKDTSAIFLFGEILNPLTFIEKETTDNFLYGVYFGFLGLVFLINLLFGTWLRDQSILTYSTYVLTVFFLHLGLNGYYPIVFSNLPGAVFDQFIDLSIALSSAVSVLMWDRFLSLSKHFPRLHKFYLFIFSILGISTFLVFTPFFVKIYTAVAFTSIFIGFLSMSLIIYLMICKKSKKSHAFYLFGFIAVVIAAGIQTLGEVNVLAMTSFTTYSYQIASIFHITLLCIGLVYRLKNIDAEKRKAERDVIIAEGLAQNQRRFITFLSHEFRSPLSAIDKAAQMVQIDNEELSDDTNERIARIRMRASQLNHQVDLFLTSEALDHGKFALEKHQKNIADTLRDAIDMIARSIKKGRLNYQINPSNFSFNADHKLLQTALTNIIKNALTYSSVDTPVDVEVSKQDDLYLLIKVKDLGYGISPEEVEQIGEIYFRAKSSEGTKGTGLGLHLTKRIIAAHDGQLSIESAPKKGTTMTISIPIGKHGFS